MSQNGIFDALDASRTALSDKLSNLVSGLGTEKDKAAHGRFEHRWLDAEQLEAMYKNDWVSATICDAPADDMTREWRQWRGGKKQVAAVAKAEVDLDVRGHVNLALKQASVFGGGAIIISDGSPDPSLELDVDAIPQGGIKFLTTLSRHELVATELIRDPMSRYYGHPEHYLLAAPTDSNAVEIHPSRVFPFNGRRQLQVSRQVEPWGDPVLQRVYEAVRNAAAVAAAGASLVQEAKVDVIRVKSLTQNAVDQEWRKRMLARFSLAAQAKSINGLLLLDFEEEYEQKKLSLADVPKILMAYLEVCAGAANMPVTRLLGRSPGGLGSDGSGEIRHYYDTCSSRQETEVRPAMRRLDTALIRHAWGSVPPTLTYDWTPLWQLNASEKAAIGLQSAQEVQVVAATGTVPFAALAIAAQSRLVASGQYPGLEEALLTAPKVTAPPAAPSADGSKPTNPKLTTKPSTAAGDE